MGYKRTGPLGEESPEGRPFARRRFTSPGSCDKMTDIDRNKREGTLWLAIFSP